ncbi:hypothetical protein NDU88_005049 [Pleurodeles waltl]|uniref:Gypsy retrotransposon integrase-like protein 1 n=1 Tax=Pleurodeles waltl TaxID=8319 RepID=A0AAV7TUE5_PLEWA|nr:hypothetical protein NDU88_005049 [Pleurodeles waltl]
MAAWEGSQGHLKLETMAQTVANRKGKRHGKPTSDVPMVVDGVPVEEEFPEPTGEDIADLGNLPELSGWQVEGWSNRAEFCKAQKECPTLQGLRHQATAQAAGEACSDHHLYWENDLLYSEPKTPVIGAARVLVVTQCYRAFLLELAHDIPLAGHLGQDNTFNRLVTHFHWPRMRVASDNFCRACLTCQASGKTGKRLKAPLIPLPIIDTPFERVGIDVIGPLDTKTALGNRFILVLVDHATCCSEAIPLRTVTAPVVTRALMRIFTRLGFPKEVVSDRGTNFMSAYMKSMWDECGVTYQFTTPYHPQSNGLVERFNKTLKGMINGEPEAMRHKWDIFLPCLLFAYMEVL